MRRRTLIRQETQVVFSTALEREVTVDFYYPKRLPRQPLRLCICQDGQDVRRMNLPQILAQLWREGYPPLLFVAVHANADRMQEYGTYARVDYMGRGARSPLYVDFVRHELLPLLTEKFTISTDPRHRTVAGFSLGALPAFDLAWHFPQTFGQVGVFSGALWWRAAKFNPQDPDANRILHLQVAQSVTVPAVRYWFQTGTEDETEEKSKRRRTSRVKKADAEEPE
ncbi:MAG: alpha/beta hydrolase-fold protein, partial [Bacteroidota bacterium]